MYLKSLSRPVLAVGLVVTAALAVACAAPGGSSPTTAPATAVPGTAVAKAPQPTPTPATSLPTAARGKITIGTQGLAPTLAPLELGAPTRIHTYAIFDTVAYVNEKGELAGRLAESWKILPDNLTWEFKLRPGMLFHDATPVDAASIKWSLDWLRDPANQSPLITRAATLDVVTAPDPLTLVVKTKAPSPVLARDIESYAISSPTFFQVNGRAGWNEREAGSGAYKVKEFVSGQRVVLVPSGTASPQTPQGALVEELIYRAIPEAATRLAAMRNKELDIAFGLEVDQAQALKREGNQLLSVPIGQTLGFSGNILTDGPSQNPMVRQAAFMSINKDELTRGVFGDLTTTANQVAVNSATGFDPAFRLSYAYNPTEAKRMLAEAGFPNGFSTKMHVLASSAPFVVLGTGVAGYLEQIGIKADIEQMDGTRYTELFTRGGMNPWYVNTWTHSTLDLDVGINWFLSDLTTSPVRYRNPRFDTALKASKVEMDAAKRLGMLQDAQRILLTEEPVMTPLVYNPYYWVAQPKVANFKILPSSKIDVTGLYLQQ